MCVFAPSLFTTVTIEAGADEFADIHFHLGGQGFWVARMVRELGQRPILCAPAGGEAGDVMRGLVASTGLDFSAVRVAASPAYVHDRRQGERVVVATGRPSSLSRHELDDLFGKTLRHALGAKVCVITGRPSGDELAPDFYRRLGVDLSAAGVRTVADFHGEEMEAYLSGGRLDVLKVSDEDLAADGVDVEDGRALWKEIDRLHEMGAEAVVVSQGSRGSLAAFDGTRLRAVAPEFEVVDHMGAGDSMTAALAVGIIRGLSVAELLQLACAAGAANVTRHGLGSSQADLVERLAALVTVEEIEA